VAGAPAGADAGAGFVPPSSASQLLNSNANSSRSGRYRRRAPQVLRVLFDYVARW
jgi:hypothetical protein